MNNYMKMFFRRIAKDFRQKNLLPLKLLFFMHSSTVLVLYPYLTIHMRELGINVEETAIMSAVTPVIAILMPPVAGMIADKIGNFRIMLASFSAVGGASALLLLLVPVGRITITYPDQVIFGISCNHQAPPILSLHQAHPCTPFTENLNDIDLRVQSCGIVCRAVISDNRSNIIMSAEKYDLQIFDVAKNSSLTYTYTLTPEDVSKAIVISETRNHKTLKNNERYLTSIRKLSESSFYFPTTLLNNFTCESGDVTKCWIGRKSQNGNNGKNINNNFEVTLLMQNVTEDDTYEKVQYYEVAHLNSQSDKNVTCGKGFDKSKVHISVSITLKKNNITDKPRYLDLSTCAPRCIGTSPREKICKNDRAVIELDMKLTFWSYLVVRVFIGIVSGTSFAMFEGAVIAILREHKADYGLQRIYGILGGMITSPLSGWMVDFVSRGKGYTDFRPIFFFYASLKMISAVLMMFINLQFKKPAQSVVTEVFAVLKKIEMIALFVSCFVLGCSWGYIESFLFWLLQDLGGSTSLMGLTITVGGLVGIPLLVISGPIIKRIGHANVLFLGFLFYAVRLFGYSFIYNPWLCLIFEAMEAITFGLCFTAAVTYAAKLSTVTTDTSVQGMLGGLYFGVGKGVGSLIGGYLIKAFEIRVTFQIFATFSALTGIIYVAFYHLYIKKLPSALKNEPKKDKCPAVEEKVNGNVEIPAVYEDALVNPGYEDTEFNDAMPENIDKEDTVPKLHNGEREQKV